jgi:hypothetical protein
LQRHCFFRSSFFIFPIYSPQNLINKGRFNLLVPIVHYVLQCKQRYGSFQDGNTQELHMYIFLLNKFYSYFQSALLQNILQHTNRNHRNYHR